VTISDVLWLITDSRCSLDLYISFDKEDNLKSAVFSKMAKNYFKKPTKSLIKKEVQFSISGPERNERPSEDIVLI
jgi:hypothetical protein